MAPIKFDETIKDKLEKRVLTPNPDAWASLADRMDKAEKNSAKKHLWWIGLAASIVGILLVSTLFLKQTDEQQTPKVVEIETPIIQGESNPKEESKKPMELPLESASETSLTQTESEPANTKEATYNKKPTLIEENPTELSSKQAVATLDEAEQKQEMLEPVKSLDAEALKVMEVVAEIKAISEGGYEVSEEELNQLLKQAERELLKDKLYNEANKMVDADALLQDVEEDLEHSFRAKVFDALKNGYDSVKTAVANRNN